MGTQVNDQMSKMFTGDIQDVILYCASKIKQMPTFRIEELSITEGRIVCISLAGIFDSKLLAAINRPMASMATCPSITLIFNEVTDGVECVGSCSNPLGNTFFTRPFAKMLLKKFLDRL